MLDKTYPIVDQAAYAALAQRAALLARPTAGVLLLSDADRADFLHRMSTNNINALQPGQSAVTVLTNPTARILYVFTVICRENDLLLLPAPGQTAALARHLRGQIFFMDKVKVHDSGDQWTRLRLMGPQAQATLARLDLPIADLPANAWIAHNAGREEGIILYQPDYDLPGYELIVPVNDAAALQTALVEAGAEVVEPTVYHVRRVELGRPFVGAELTEEYNPLEVGLAWTCAEDKGCYTGQEIIARQITYNKVTKQLVGLRSDELLAAGSDVSVAGRSVGTVTSAAYSPALAAPVALAVIKRPHHTPGETVQVGNVAAQVVALPLVE